MTPTPQEFSNHQGEKSRTLERAKVVISGMSGLYPQSDSVYALSDILYNKKNPMMDTKSRWKFLHPEVVGFIGKVPKLQRFDAQFFKVHFRLGNNMDPMGRKVLEQAYQAIYDAGVSPEHLSGKKVGVYVGTCFSETEKACFYVATSRTGFGIAGCSKTMFANRISYWLNAKGPSMSIDESCCSSIAALEQAYLAITRGECDAAIVGGTNLCLHPQSSVHYSRIMQMCKDGKTKSFDQNADGCAKSEAINVLFLQKATDALRVYAEVVYVNSEYTSTLKGETTPRYGFYRDPMKTANFLKTFYSKAGISPSEVEYVEAFGSAVPEADKSELEAIDNVFCKNRNVPLPVGSVMSNIGYGEAASGISAITKVLLGYETGLLAGNLHLTTPRQDVSAMREGRIDVITDHCRFQRTYVGVNALSITGVNAHVLLHGHYKPKDPNRYSSSIPRLVTISGRHESAVKKIIDDLKSRPIDPEELALFHNIHETKISGHMGRGFIILDTKDQDTVSLNERIEYFDEMKRPLWYVYSGMGSQWPGMGEQLMRIPIFAAAIERCHRILQPKGIDLLNIVLSRDKTIFDNILHSFVGIAAIQIGLTNILMALGLSPNKIIGHSVGELGCAYADGCLTAEEMILAAYYRGLVSIQTPLIRGSMAAVGLGYQQIKNMCPPEIEIACHNGPQSCTISGPESEMRTFVDNLSAKGIFAKEVPCSNIAYHSRYIADAGPELLKYMKEVIKGPKLRSEKWVSTSTPQEKWNDPSAMFCSAEYLTNNLLNPVLFEETAALIPSNAVLVEIAPHGLLQAILKRSLHPNCRNIGLTRRAHPDNAYLVLEAIGQLYIEGYIPKIKELYPKVVFPVSTGTPMLSHQVEWAHNEIWPLPLYVSAHKATAASCKFVISIHDEEYKYLRGHVVRGKILYPFAAVLVSVWDTFAMILNVSKKQISVQFTDVHVYVQPVLHNQRQLKLRVSINRGNGQFEVLDGNSKVVTGFIAEKESRSQPNSFQDEVMDFSSEDIYQLLNMRDYSYSDAFKSIHGTNADLSTALLEWNDNWVTLIDGMLQLNALRQTHDGVTVPKHIRSLHIDHEHHSEFSQNIDGKSLLRAQVSDIYDNTRCGGILIENIKFNDLPPLSSDRFALKRLKFIPRFDSSLDAVTALHVYLQIVTENVGKNLLNVVGIRSQTIDLVLSKEIKALDYVPHVVIKYHEVELAYVLRNQDQLASKVDLIVSQNLQFDVKLYQTLQRALKRGTFVLNYSNVKEIENNQVSKLYSQVCSNGNIQLLRWNPEFRSIGAALTVNDDSDLSMLSAAHSKLRHGSRMRVCAPYPAPRDLTELVKSWRKGSSLNQVNVILTNTNIAEKNGFDTDADLVYNIWNDGIWGGEYYVPWHEEHDVKQRILLQSLSMGDPRSLQWVAAPAVSGAGVKVTVLYSGIHSGDILRATGSTNFKDHNTPDGYGMDFSGLTERGERVMGIVLNGACSSEILAQPELLWPVPAHWSFEDAATVPLAYMHAFYCLTHRSIGDRILHNMHDANLLVHGGAGSLGQAVISVAFALGYQVFTTVSDIKKKRFLLKLFPQLKDEHVGNSRDASFGDLILSATKDVGCHIIISCVKGDLKNMSLKCCAFSGVTLDTTVVTQRENYNFGLAYLTKERSYISVDFASILKNKDFDEIKRLHKCVSEGIISECVRPLSRITYSPNDVVRAIRLMEISQHRGKVLLRLEDSIDVKPRFDCKPDSCYLVICDQGDLGIQLADRLISRGAKKMYLHYTNPPSYLRYEIRKWRDLNVEIGMSTEDLRNEEHVSNLIHNAMNLGSLDGIYVISMNTYSGYDQGMFNYLDVLSRKLCTTLRYFAVISSNNTIGLNTCLSRAKDNYPSMKLSLENLKMFDSNDRVEINATSVRGIVDVLESSLNKNNLILAAKCLPESYISLIDQISAVSGVHIQEEYTESKLEECGIDTVKAQRVTRFLRHMHNISYNEEYLQSLTVQDVKDLEKVITESTYKNVKGLDTFYSYVDPDELLATAEIVAVSTLTSTITTSDHEFDGSQTYLCIIPGLEGHYKRFCTLAERLKVHAIVLQPGLDKPHETIQELADRYTQTLLKKLTFKNKFYILGYEVGVLVALEVAANLERHGLQGTVFCIGNDPSEFKLVLEEQLNKFKTDEELQNAIIYHMFKLMTDEDTKKLEKALKNVSNWHERIDACVRTLLGRVPHSAQYARVLIEAAFARIKQVKYYTTKDKPLRSKLVLLRSDTSIPLSSEAISTRSLQPVVTHDLAAPLRYATEDLQCTAIINKYLDEDLLEDFENKNLCETYLRNANTFMSNSLTSDV